MKPTRHIIISLPIGVALWFFTKSISAGILCFASGVLVDIDHVIEYIIHYGIRGITFKKVYAASEQTGRQEGDYRFKRLFLIFHSGEIAILIWPAAIFTRNIYLLAVALGYSSHLILDCIKNQLYPYSYLILWRAIKKFDIDKLFKSEENGNVRFHIEKGKR